MNYPEEILNEINNHNHIITRFPPEPNGFLHIGHAKAMCVDFGVAEYANSIEGKTAECILRFDDTNPSNDYQLYIDHIIENVEWLGFKPSKITFSSDYFGKLYSFALQLIKQGDGYICELSSDDVSKYREKKIDSPYKKRTVEENLELFEKMRIGEVDEGKMCLRMKGDLNDPNSCMWDTVFYRVMKKRHPKTGDKWCIYPTYDFTHCIVDSLEGITHSLCSKEFEIRRKSYYWLLDVLGLKKPLVYEFARLNIDGYNLSKRYIKKLVEDKVVESWDDPSLLTLNGLRNRGYTPSCIKNFCNDTGITKNDGSIEFPKLRFNFVDENDNIVPRRVVIPEPLEAEIIDYDNLTDEDKLSKFYDYPQFMGKIVKGDTDELDKKHLVYRNVNLTKTIYINKKDFRIDDDKKYYGFSLNKVARLRYNEYFECVKVDVEDEIVKKIYLKKVIPEKPKKVKGNLSWVSSESKEVKLIDYNLHQKNISIGRGEKGIVDANNGDRFQFERIGYFYKYNDTFICTTDMKSSYK